MYYNCNIVIFDGVCNLCNAAVNFVIKRDPTGVFRFAPMQSDIAQELIAMHRGAEFDFTTILLIKNGTCHERSDAVLEIARELERCRFLFRILKLTPKPIRDFFYDAIAKCRYRLFGKRDKCIVPTQNVRNRFIDSGTVPPQPPVDG